MRQDTEKIESSPGSSSPWSEAAARVPTPLLSFQGKKAQLSGTVQALDGNVEGPLLSQQPQALECHCALSSEMDEMHDDMLYAVTDLQPECAANGPTAMDTVETIDFSLEDSSEMGTLSPEHEVLSCRDGLDWTMDLALPEMAMLGSLSECLSCLEEAQGSVLPHCAPDVSQCNLGATLDGVSC